MPFFTRRVMERWLPSVGIFALGGFLLGSIIAASTISKFMSAWTAVELSLFLIGIGYGVFHLTQLVFPDEEKLAAQKRLGVEEAIREHSVALLRWLSPIYRLLLPRIQQISMPNYRKKKKKLFISAGLDTELTADEFVALKVLMGVIFLIGGAYLLVAFGYSLSWLPPTLFFVLGIYYPDLWVRSIRAKRIHEIRRQLPHVVDLLTLSVEAGQDFIGALSRVTLKSRPGPLQKELERMLKEIQLGTLRSDALRNLANRVDIPELSSFATILIQADQLGASIGPVLRAQSDQMRTNRFQMAEQAGARAASQILIPMILFIMPAILIAILGPVFLGQYYGGFLGQALGR